MSSQARIKGTLALLFFAAVAVLILSAMVVVTVEPGHAAVGDFFGEVSGQALYEGFHIVLPPFIVKAIESKKEREQEAEKQRAELDRYRTEQEQKIAQAEAERKAAEEQAERQRILADARAYEIEKINDAIASNPAYVQPQALEALKKIAEDPAAKLYFIDGDSNMPIPLMHMGDR